MSSPPSLSSTPSFFFGPVFVCTRGAFDLTSTSGNLRLKGQSCCPGCKGEEAGTDPETTLVLRCGILSFFYEKALGFSLKSH